MEPFNLAATSVASLVAVPRRVAQWLQRRGRRALARLGDARPWLRGESHYLQMVAERTVNAVMIIDASRRIVWVNDGFERLTGFTAAEALGRRAPELFECERTDPATVAAKNRALAERRPFRGEILHRRKDGALRWYDLDVSPLYDDESVYTGLIAIKTDITARKEVELALRASEARLTDALKIGKSAYWEFDPCTWTFTFNDAFYDLFHASAESEGGYRMSAEQYTQRFVHPDDAAIVADEIAVILASTERHIERDIEHRFVAANGRTGQLSVRVRVERAEDGRITRWYGMVQDVTETREATDRTRLALSGGRLGLWDWNLQNRSVAFDERWAKTLGTAAAQVLTEDEWRERVHPDDRPVMQDSLRRHFAGEAPYDCAFRVRHADGSWRWLAVTGSVVSRDRDRRPTRMVGTYRDVTEERRADDERQRREAALAHTSRLARVGWFEIDAVTLRATWSEELRAIHEVDPGVELTLADALAFCLPEDRPNIVAAVERCLHDGQSFDVELRLVTAKGQGLCVRLLGEAVVRDGRVAKVSGALQDLTALVEAREQARDASRSKSEFLANMSHEIRTPLTSILGYADLLRDEPDVAADATRRAQAIETIRWASQHLLALIDDILDLSKIESGSLRLHVEPTDLPALLRGVELMMRPRADEKGVSLTVRLVTPVPGIIRTDVTRLRQVLVNLVGNATKFTDAGSVDLRVAATETELGPRLVVEIQDSGPGMTESQAARLFQPFTQADESVTRRHGGTGLGLVISRRLARLLGGDVRIAWTRPGEGSCFRLDVELDAEPGCATISELAIVARPRPAHTPFDLDIRLDAKILVVEDTPVNQRLVSFYLQKAGALVEACDNGLLALDRLAAADAEGQPFDLIVSDMQMPEMDGYTLARTLRARGARLPIIALTAHAMATDERQCLDAGCNDYLTKPIDRRALVATCARWLATSRAAAA